MGIRDQLRVTNCGAGRYTAELWGDDHTIVIGSFPVELEAWGVVALVIEYHERHGYDVERAVCAAMCEYWEACADASLVADTDREALAYQDHYASVLRESIDREQFVYVEMPGDYREAIRLGLM